MSHPFLCIIDKKKVPVTNKYFFPGYQPGLLNIEKKGISLFHLYITTLT